MEEKWHLFRPLPIFEIIIYSGMHVLKDKILCNKKKIKYYGPKKKDKILKKDKYSLGLKILDLILYF